MSSAQHAPGRSDAKRAYRQNSSDLRAFGRFAKTPEARTTAIKDACSARAFWYGDRWALPAPLPAQAALTVVSGRLRADPLLCAQHVMPLLAPNDPARAIVVRVILGALRLDRATGSAA